MTTKRLFATLGVLSFVSYFLRHYYVLDRSFQGALKSSLIVSVCGTLTAVLLVKLFRK